MPKFFAHHPHLTTLLLILLLVLLICPFPFLMLTMTQMVLVTLIGFAFIVWAAFHWQEKAEDEREELHRFLASRLAYFVGAGILMVGVLIESLMHDLDPWLVAALIGMLIAKTLSHSRTNRDC
jgi:heme O synthase-like polyprenyltransferase